MEGLCGDGLSEMPFTIVMGRDVYDHLVSTKTSRFDEEQHTQTCSANHEEIGYDQCSGFAHHLVLNACVHTL